MIELNIKFQEEYKRLDTLCKEMYSSSEGVSEYIRHMEATPYKLRWSIYDWDDIYKKLKHMRWIRNQLAHEVDTLYLEMCGQDDIDWIINFYNSILKVSDPLALAYRTNESEDKQQKINEQNTAHTTPSDNFTQYESKKISLWQKIKAAIKNFFS